MPTARESTFTGAIGSKIYVIGGGTNTTVFNVNEIYDTTTNSWSTAAPMPTPRWLGATAVVNNILYAIGGANADGSTTFSAVEAYDPKTSTWSTKAPMPFGADSIYATVDSGIIYVIGGFAPGSGRLASVLAYNPSANSWSTLAPLNLGKSQSAVGTFGAWLVSAGGLANSGVTTDDEAYNIARNSWATLAPMSTARNSGCFGNFGTMLYVAGGNAVGNTVQLNTMDAYSIVLNSWTTTGLPQMPHGVVNAGSATAAGNLYCFGGSNNGNPSQGGVFNYLQIYRPGPPTAPSFGSFDTPANNSSATGAIGVSGWTLDAMEVPTVDIWRDPLSGETPQSNGLIFLGYAGFVNGARPDVAAVYPTYPSYTAAGWGYQLLTNELPNSNGSGLGNGTYRIHAIAHNSAISAELGVKTITVNNASSLLPFGTIDTPAQGGTASGSAYINFGWALTPQPSIIPMDGSTIFVYVDGAPVGHPVYNQSRADIQSLFPGYANTNGAVGYYILDTTKLTNGVHTMAWSVADNDGHAQGIGSRYFTVQN